MTVDQDAGKLCGIQCLKALDDDVSGLPFVVAGDFGRGQLAGHGNVAVEVVGVGGAEDRDRKPRLGKGGRVGGMRVDDAADRPKAMYRRRWVGVSEDGLRSPSTVPPSRSTTTMSSGVSDA